MLSNFRFAPRYEPLGKRFAVPALVVILLVYGEVSAKADYFDIVPSLGVKQEYNDNLFSSVDKTTDLITTFSPGVELQDKTERLEARMFTSIQGVKYWRQKQYDAVDYSLLGSAQYLLSPRLNLSASAEYDRVSTPDRELGPVALVLNTVRRYQQLYSLRNEYKITEKNSGIAACSYSQYDFAMVPLLSFNQTVTSPSAPPSPPS